MQVNARSSVTYLPARWLPVRCLPALGVAGLIALAGCTSGHHQVAGAGPPPAAPASTAGPVPLGRLSGLFARGSGFGQVRPARIDNGGDPTGLVTGIAWRSWGTSRAIGTGQAEWVGPHQSVANGHQEQATVVAFRLGICNGKQMYRAVEWYFPQHGQSFSARHYEDICTGSFVPGG